MKYFLIVSISCFSEEQVAGRIVGQGQLVGAEAVGRVRSRFHRAGMFLLRILIYVLSKPTHTYIFYNLICIFWFKLNLFRFQGRRLIQLIVVETAIRICHKSALLQHSAFALSHLTYHQKIQYDFNHKTNQSI